MDSDPHRKYERRQVGWLVFSFAMIALVAAAIMLYGAWLAGWRPMKD
jgi:hypothetical protein